MKSVMGHYADKALACGVPLHTVAGVELYIEYGVPPGGFLTSVICNDLFGAMGRADEENRARLFAICKFFYADAPAGCHGSRDAFTAWCAKGGLKGEK